MADTKDQLIQEMYDAGAHLGYSKTKRHPSVKPFIVKTIHGRDIINLEKTVEQLEKAISFLKEVKDRGHQILFVGTKPEARGVVRRYAELIDMPFVTERWIGGTLTNFPEIRKRIQQLITLSEQQERDELVAATKKEKLMIEREIERLEKKFGGLRNLKGIPGALFVIDPKKEEIAVTEARKMKVPVVALANTNANLEEITYPIVANNTNLASIEFFVKKISEALR